MRLDRITTETGKMNGQPVIRALRLTVKRVVELVALYPDRQELLHEYPELEEEDIRQALIFAASALDDQIVEHCVSELSLGAMVTVEPGRIRIRRLGVR